MNSIRSYLHVAILAAGALPLLLLTLILQTKLSQGIIRDAKTHTSDVVHELTGRIEEVMESVRKDLSSVQDNPIVTNPSASPKQRETEMLRLVGNYDDFFDISIYDSYGELITSTNVDGSLAQQYRDHTRYFKTAVSEGEEVISSPKRKLQREELFMDVYYPVKRGEDVVNVIKASLKFDKVHAALSRKLGENGYFVLLDERANRLYFPDNEQLMQKHSHVPQFLPSEDDPQARVVEVAGEVSLDHTSFLFAAKRFNPEEEFLDDTWTLIAYQPYAEAQRLAHNTAVLLWSAFCIVVVLAGFAGNMLARRLAQPIHPLTKAAKEVIAQNWSHATVPTKGPIEIQEVANSFNQMVREIQNHQLILNKKVADRTQALAHKQLELSDAMAKMEAAFQSSREGILVVSPEGELQTINSSFLGMFDLKLHPHQVRSLPELEKQVDKLVEKAPNFEGFTHPVAAQSEAKDGDWEEVEWHVRTPTERFLKVYCVDVRGKDGQVRAYMWVFRDITEARRLETSLQQAQKMEAVGRLAGGIAHDFNNLLTGIIGNLDLLSFEMDPASGLSEHLTASRQAAQRAAELVKQLLGFSRQSFLNLGHFCANDLVGEVTNLLRSSFDPRFEIHEELDGNCWGIHVDSTQINQVLMNLCVNARDAMEDQKSGQLLLSTKNMTLTAQEARARGNEQAKEGDFVVISVADNGTGIPPEILNRIFEPFFTTKGQGKGTGLGLATSLGIIAQHGGWMECDSRAGEGTTFLIFLPKDTEVSAPKQKPKRREISPDDCGTGTILLVDDEVTVRLVTESYLRKLGYNVITAGNGKEGLETYKERSAEIDAAMLDLTMPVMSGAELFSKLKSVDPDLPVVIYSGYMMDEEEFAIQNGSKPSAILCKPFEIDDVAKVMKSILGNEDGDDLAEAA